MAKEKRSKETATEKGKRTGFFPYYIERMASHVERFIDRISKLVESRAVMTLNHIALRLFIFLLFCIGLVFFLSGSVKMINHTVHFPGIGQLIIGSVIVAAAGILLFAIRRR